MSNYQRFIIFAGVGLFFLSGVVSFNSCSHSAYVMPDSLRTNDPTICFERDILPIFVSNCTQSGCHNASSHEEGYVLDNYANIVRKGIVPGNIAASKIWESIAITKSGEKKMPANAPSLSAAKLDLIKRWIVAGAVDGGNCTSVCDSNNFTFSGAIQPLMDAYCVGCHSSASASGGSLADYASIKAAAVGGRLVGDVQHLAGYNAMPKGGSKLTDCQIAQITKWVAAGALQN